MPKWIVLPPDVRRSDVDVRLDYSLDHAKFTWVDEKGKKLTAITAKCKNRFPIYRSGNLAYEIVTANGVTEIIEHRGNGPPVFFVNDDPVLRKELLASSKPEKK